MPTAPQNQRLIKILGNEKDVGAVHLAYPIFEALVNLTLRISNQLAHVMRYYIRVQHLFI